MEKCIGLDVVVVGGGAVGISAAYFLQQAGMRVTVIERSKVAVKAPRAPFVDCVNSSEHPTYLSQLGKEILFPLFEDLGYITRIVSRYCYTSQSTITASSVRRGAANGELLMNEMLLDLKGIVHDRGGRIFEDLEVTGLATAAGKVVGVNTSQGQFLADEVVVSAGAMSQRFDQQLGISLGLREERIPAGDDLVNVPITNSGHPYVGRPDSVGGAIVAVGHDINAISALAVGSIVARMVANPSDMNKLWNDFSLGKPMKGTDFPWPGV